MGVSPLDNPKSLATFSGNLPPKLAGGVFRLTYNKQKAERAFCIDAMNITSVFDSLIL